MNKFFKKQLIQNSSEDISQKDIDQYRLTLLCEMKRIGATENDLSLISNCIIINSIKNKRSPKEVAWAILQ